MDIFEASDYDFLISRRIRRAAAWALILGIALLPPVRDWYLGQVQEHASHLTEEIMGRHTAGTSQGALGAP